MSANKIEEETKILETEIFLIIDSDGEIYSTNYIEYSDAIGEGIPASGFGDPIVVGLTVKVPSNAFGPKLQLEIDVPKEVFETKSIPADLNEVIIPVELNKKKTTMKINETLEDGKGSGLIALLKKVLIGK